MNITGYTDKGKVRSSNQDAFSFGLFDDNAAWAVVCDGMGGASGGNVASEMAVEKFSASLKMGYRANMSGSSIKNLLETSISAANICIFDESKKNKELSGMGTTIVAVLICDKTAYIAHAGDSRAYLLSDDIFIQITRDHSVVQNMIEHGKITTEEARVHPRRNVITRALGVEELVEIEFNVVDLNDGDMLLLCTDGLTNYLAQENIKQIINKSSEGEIAIKLIEAANDNGGGDNITAVIINNII